MLRKRQRKSFWKILPTLILSVQETDISSLKKRLKLLRKSTIPVRILFSVCLGAPKQEQWIERNRDALKVRVAMGIGGSLDVFAGKVERAPEIFSVKQVWNGFTDFAKNLGV